MLKRWIGPDAGVLIAALLLFAGLSYQIARQAKPPKEGEHPRRTMHSAQPGGWRAWFLLLRERGVSVSQTQDSPAAWEKSDADIIISGPVWEGDSFSGEAFQNQWTESDAKSALAWVESGGVLFMATDSRNEIITKLGLELEEYPSDKTSRENQPGVFTQPAAFFNKTDEVMVPGKPYLSKVPEKMVSLMKRGDKTVMAVRQRGEGLLVVFTSPGALDNAHLAQNARFAAQVIEAFGSTDDNGKETPPTVVFDEYHQGFRKSDGFWEAVGQPGKLVALQILALALLMVYSAGRRFGLAMPLPPASRVSSEYVTSLADLYRRARAYDTVLDNVYQPFWRDLCKTVGVSTDTPKTEAVRRASAALVPAASAGDVETRLLTLINECEEGIQGAVGAKPIKEADMLRLVRALSEMRKELSLSGAYSVVPV